MRALEWIYFWYKRFYLALHSKVMPRCSFAAVIACCIIARAESQCGAGMYLEMWDGACTKCVAGKFSPSASTRTTCFGCTAGNYGNTSGATACLSCEYGKYINVTGATTCLNCISSTYASVMGSLYCTTCQVGTYISALLILPIALFVALLHTIIFQAQVHALGAVLERTIIF